MSRVGPVVETGRRPAGARAAAQTLPVWAAPSSTRSTRSGRKRRTGAAERTWTPGQMRASCRPGSVRYREACAGMRRVLQLVDDRNGEVFRADCVTNRAVGADTIVSGTHARSDCRGRCQHGPVQTLRCPVQVEYGRERRRLGFVRRRETWHVLEPDPVHFESAGSADNEDATGWPCRDQITMRP